MRVSKGDQGFLLVEMLIALSVIAVMAALMSRFLGQLGSIARLESEIVIQSELEAGVSYLKRTLEAARPLRLLSAEEGTNPYMDGTATSLKVAAVTRQGLHALALRDIHFYLENDNGTRKLVHSVTPRRVVNGKPVGEGAKIEILNNVSEVSFEYGSPGSWGSSWKKDGTLPPAIRFSISRTSGNKNVTANGLAVIGTGSE